MSSADESFKYKGMYAEMMSKFGENFILRKSDLLCKFTDYIYYTELISFTEDIYYTVKHIFIKHPLYTQDQPIRLLESEIDDLRTRQNGWNNVKLTCRNCYG